MPIAIVDRTGDRQDGQHGERGLRSTRHTAHGRRPARAGVSGLIHCETFLGPLVQRPNILAPHSAHRGRGLLHGGARRHDRRDGAAGDGAEPRRIDAGAHGQHHRLPRGHDGAGCRLPAGRAAGFGARNLFATAIAVFTLASLLCGISPNFWTLIFARVLQGAAAAFMSPVGPPHRASARRRRPGSSMPSGSVVWPALIAPVIGPPLGRFSSRCTRRALDLPDQHSASGLSALARAAVHPQACAPGRCALRRPRIRAHCASLGRADPRTIARGAWRHRPGRRRHFSSRQASSFGYFAVRHARRHPAPVLDLAAIRFPTFALSTVTAGLAARIAISMTPFLLPLMFQIGFGMSPFEAGVMVLVYMAGNLSMKSVTTPILRRFGFRDVIRVNGILCAASLFACALVSPERADGARLCAAFRRGNDAIDELHVDEHAGVRRSAGQPACPGATTLAALSQQAAGAMVVRGGHTRPRTFASGAQQRPARADRLSQRPVRLRCADGDGDPLGQPAPGECGRGAVGSRLRREHAPARRTFTAAARLLAAGDAFSLGRSKLHRLAAERRIHRPSLHQ